MTPARLLLPALSLAAVLASGLGAAADAAPALEAVNGTIQSIDLARHAVVVQAGGGAFTAALDRNTLVYLPSGLATVADLRAGDRVRVARVEGRASWIEVREDAERGPASRPAQGTGPGGEAPPAADTTGPGRGAPPASPGPGSQPGGSGSGR